MSQEHKPTGAAPAQEPEQRPAPEQPGGKGTEQQSPALDHETVSKLQQQLEEAQTKVQDNWNLFLGARAEMDNLRKRTERELANAHKFALEKFVNELLPVRDSLEMGLDAAGETADPAKLREGTELTLKMLSDALEKFGVKEVNPQGEKFNPTLHEAMTMQPSHQVEPNTVLHVVQKGYLLNDRLVRPAMVVVSQGQKKS